MNALVSNTAIFQLHWNSSTAVFPVSYLFFLDHLKISEGLGGPLNDFYASCLTTEIHCSITVKDDNKFVGAALNLFQNILALLLIIC
jgi:hypothetical protein